MKRHLSYILSGLAAACLLSCSKAEEVMTVVEEGMELRAVTEVPSRGVVTGTVFPTTRSMHVSADVMPNTGGSGNFFTDRTFSYSAGAWVPSVTTYWPSIGDLDILAYSEGSASVSAAWTNATQVVLTCADCTADDILMGGATNSNKNSNAVAFKHCLSQVKFTAKASVGSVVKIKYIDITAKKGATLTVTKSAGSAATSVATALSGSAYANRVFSGSTAMATTAVSIGTPLLLPAQTPSLVTVGYTLTTNGTESPVMTVWQTVDTPVVAGNSYVYAIDITLTGMTLTASLTDWADGGSTYLPLHDPANGHAYVDLGLTYGGNKILFATMNLGASSPEEYGDYYAWAETTKRYTNLSGNTVVGGTFTWSNALYHTVDDYDTGWTKYIPTGQDSYWSGEGSPDNKVELDASDDVVRKEWGGDWRMPSQYELALLVNSCTWEYTADYNGTGVKGYVLTGPNGNTLFLPLAGYCYRTSRYDAGTSCYLWSSSLYASNPHLAWDLFAGWTSEDDAAHVMNARVRCYGYSVRAVLPVPSSQNP